MHSITNKQKDILNSFSCDRLSNCSDRTIVLNQFESEKGKMLVKYLKDKGHIEDSSGESAFYLIQNKEKLPLLFFSLKCGSLFSPFDIEEFENRAKITNKMLDVLKAQRDESDPFQNMVYNQLKDIAIKSNIEVDEYIQRIKRQLNHDHDFAKTKIEYYRHDILTDSQNPILRVGETLPGIEIIHFCANDKARDYWKSLKIFHPMGEVLFWYYVIPKIIEIKNLAGCKYIYLFAADNSEDRSLVNYYNVSLKFKKPEGMLGTNKPFYDYCCEFLAQEINTIVIEREKYFSNFNIDSKDIIA